jgi:hypothetical protein
MADVGKEIKEGRHVGLDFYDLLIEALMWDSPRSLVRPLGPPARCGLVSSHKIHQFSEVLRLLSETPPVIETVTGVIREYVPDHNLLVRIQQ